MRPRSSRLVVLSLAVTAACAGGTELVTVGVGTETDGAGTIGNIDTGGDTMAATSAATGGVDATGSGADSTAGESTGGDCLAEELCDGLDNTCDDVVDEGCDCTPGDTQPCYSGPSETSGVGACQPGTQVCDDAGAWGSCDGEVVPGDEICNAIDDDCDAETDEGYDDETCGQGICQVTTATCVDGVPQDCTPGTPQTETCNGSDDDCDGEVDEDCPCDDGQVEPCYSGPMGTVGVGMCQSGTHSCSNGTWGACTGDVTPGVEVCDGLDNDCDAAADENNPGGGAGCNTGLVGVCAIGHIGCQGGSLSCLADNVAGVEVCDGLDNDCDTGVDEGNPGGGGACSTGQLGVCGPGIQQCTSGALVCNQNVASSAETCDGLDNDCDGTADEGNPGGGVGCNTGLAGVCSVGTSSCSGGTVVCNQNVAASTEVCDGLDNDCDTGVDEGNPGGGAACFTGIPGTCAVGVNACSSGAVVCTQTVFPTAEICVNGNDEDCNGTADDGCGCAHGECVNSTALANGCSPCVSEICAVDPFCCSDAWDSICIAEVATVCGSWQCSTCTHSPCFTGGPLVSGCDAGVNCVSSICSSDAFCCTTSWDAICVGEVATICGLTC